MSALQQAQRELADLEQAHAWLRSQAESTGRREAHIAEQNIARMVAELKRLTKGELDETAGYVIWDCELHRAWTGQADDLWDRDLNRAHRFPSDKAAEQKLKEVQAGQSRHNRWRLSVQPLRKLIHQQKGRT